MRGAGRDKYLGGGVANLLGEDTNHLESRIRLYIKIKPYTVMLTRSIGLACLVCAWTCFPQFEQWGRQPNYSNATSVLAKELEVGDFSLPHAS